MTKPQAICSIENCDDPAKARGWCSKHWTRWWKHDDPNTTYLIRGGDVLDRLANKFTVGDGCWEWTAKAKAKFGYGQITDDDGRSKVAYKVLYRIMVGDVPEGMELDHVCKNVLCIRPDHLEPVTHRENMRRGNGWAGVNARKTHCGPCGLPLSGPNLIIDKSSGSRRCRACTNAAARRYAAKKRHQ